MLISTFELLVKRQLPTEVVIGGVTTILPTSPLSRPLIQGYFLTIANVTESKIKIDLNFNGVTAINLPAFTATVLDNNGSNIVGDATPLDPKSYTYPLELEGISTCSLILIPDVTDQSILDGLNIEARGYVDVRLANDSPTSSASLLITPEHRGTFFRAGINDLTPFEGRQLGEIAYSLPTASGRSLFQLMK